jgi:hypothetical protein
MKIKGWKLEGNLTLTLGRLLGLGLTLHRQSAYVDVIDLALSYKHSGIIINTLRFTFVLNLPSASSVYKSFPWQKNSRGRRPLTLFFSVTLDPRLFMRCLQLIVGFLFSFVYFLLLFIVFAHPDSSNFLFGNGKIIELYFSGTSDVCPVCHHGDICACVVIRLGGSVGLTSMVLACPKLGGFWKCNVNSNVRFRR